MGNLARIIAIALPLTAMSAAAIAQPIFVPTAPPPIQRELPPPPPRTGVVWHPGFWKWDGRQYFWEPGSYVAPPRRYAHWVAGHWARRPGGYLWVEGQWR